MHYAKLDIRPAGNDVLVTARPNLRINPDRTLSLRIQPAITLKLRKRIYVYRNIEMMNCSHFRVADIRAGQEDIFRFASRLDGEKYFSRTCCIYATSFFYKNSHYFEI